MAAILLLWKYYTFCKCASQVLNKKTVGPHFEGEIVENW